jgi:hypothetical protein
MIKIRKYSIEIKRRNNIVYIDYDPLYNEIKLGDYLNSIPYALFVFTWAW